MEASGLIILVQWLIQHINMDACYYEANSVTEAVSISLISMSKICGYIAKTFYVE